MLKVHHLPQDVAARFGSDWGTVAHKPGRLVLELLLDAPEAFQNIAPNDSANGIQTETVPLKKVREWRALGAGKGSLRSFEHPFGTLGSIF